MIAEVKIAAGWGAGQTLLCPGCGNDNLHHHRVTVYERPEDDAETDVTTIDASHLAWRRSTSKDNDNPSARRHGLTIAFFCENCPAEPVLTIAQHKGQTLLRWRQRT